MSTAAAGALRSAHARMRNAGLVIGIWLVAALLFMPQFLVLNNSKPVPDPLWQVAYNSLALFMLWALLTPLLLRLASRFPIERRHWLRRVGLHVLLAVAVSLLHLGGMGLLLLPLLPDEVPLQRLFASLVIGTAATNVLVYFAVIAAGHALDYLARYRAVEQARADAHLSALRAQLHPHFLFNTLNALSELVHRDPALAERLILRLSDLLRRTLGSGDAHEVTLAEELDFTRSYLDIQQALMGARLRTRIEVPDGLLAARVPNMLLQPLIENAIRHGLAPRRAGGLLQVGAHVQGAQLVVEVSDDGDGSAGTGGQGIGLQNTRARLATLYGEDASLQVASLEPGFRARVTLPLGTAERR